MNDLRRQYPNLVRERGRHGREGLFYREGKGLRVHLRAGFGSAAFDHEYKAAAAYATAGRKRPVAAPDGSLAWLIRSSESRVCGARKPARPTSSLGDNSRSSNAASSVASLSRRSQSGRLSKASITAPPCCLTRRSFCGRSRCCSPVRLIAALCRLAARRRCAAGAPTPSRRRHYAPHSKDRNGSRVADPCAARAVYRGDGVQRSDVPCDRVGPRLHERRFRQLVSEGVPGGGRPEVLPRASQAGSTDRRRTRSDRGAT